MLTPEQDAEIRAYLGRVLAWPAEGEGWIGIHNTYMPKEHKAGDKLPHGFGAIAADVPSAVKQIVGISNGKSNRDIYVCLGTQERYVEWKNPKTGEVRFRPNKNRANISQSKSLYIDVDFKGGKNGYNNQTEAEAALDEFYQRAAIRKPNVAVHSGNGLHLYWVHDRPLSRDNWQRYGSALAEATRVHWLKCDAGVTVDVSRILRPPGTLNYKSDPPRPVRLHAWVDGDYSWDDTETALKPYMSILTPKVSMVADDFAFLRGQVSPIKFQSVEEMTELGAGIVVGGPPIPLSQMVGQCGFIKEALTTGGKDYDNHLWNLTTLLSVFTAEGEKAAHWMAKGHKDYQPQTTSTLYARKVIERERGTGWPRCSTIKNAGSVACATCPHFAKNQYPFSFAAPPTPVKTTPAAARAVVQAVGRGPGSPLPPGYMRNADNLILRQKVDAEGNIQEVFPTTAILYDAYVTTHGVAEFHFTANVTPGSDEYEHKHVALPYRYLHPPFTEMVGTLADAAVPVPDKYELGEFLVSWLETLKGTEFHNQYVPYGWAVRPDEGIEGFSFNRTLFTKDGERVSGVHDNELAKQYSVHGKLDPWIDAAKAVTDTKRPAMDAIIASAFAGPLVQFTGEDGLFLNVYSDLSGAGKTTAMRVAQAVWGDPSKAMYGLRDTINSVQTKMGSIANITGYWDEIKGSKAMEHMATMIFDLTQGRGRGRLNSNITLRETASWKTMLVVACNNSLADAVNEIAKGNDAGFYRLFELQTDKPTEGVLSAVEAAAHRMAINENYGHAGLIYSKFLGNNYDRIASDLTKVKKQFSEELLIEPQERYWLNAVVVLWLGAFYANKLGLTQIDLAALKAEMFGAITRYRTALAFEPLVYDEIQVTNLLMAYLVDMQPHTIRTTDIWLSAGKPANGFAVPVSASDIMNKRGIHIQYGVASKVLRMSQVQFHEWLQKKGYQKTTVLKLLTSKLGMQAYAKRALCAGVDGISTARISVYDIDCSSPDMQGFMDNNQPVAPGSNVVPFKAAGTP